ncbi:hydantoinase/oxoprolinase family protein [Labrys monachus]|uniref:N-methylhydantoinase A n=1 Tax=Labrys monachus TaxID=217067 RepID=A0ABU0FFI1_9HYPH|nr:hydantoinase/oxoprolinase family protein [Labrys monachus]MDQ0392805.1 N-methylhydantoinase A [Labrys monachus]
MSSVPGTATPSRRLRAAVDVGGTFIDVVLADQHSGRARIAKVLHRSGNQGEDIGEALARLAASFEAGLGDVDSLVIGTTVVTNALLEGALARTALVTTEGFRDVIEIARMTRPASYDLHRRRPPPIVPPERRFAVRERLAHDGEVLVPLDEHGVARIASTLRGLGVEAIAVCLLYSFVDPSHERRVAAAVQDLGAFVSVSSEVLPVFREYERTVATVINAATAPVMGRFLDGLASLSDRGLARTYIMGSGGGCLTLPEARRFPIKCAMSGPAGGVVGAARFAAEHGIDGLITLDVGGTSSDVAMLSGGQVPFTEERAIAGYPIAVPSVEVETVGAGGGSIAFIDATGLLKVGPRSAGASPGPACYGRGGTEPTVTDAHVALNRLGSDGMLAGSFALDRGAAVAAIERVVAGPLGLGWARAAQGILAVTTANMVRAVRAMSVGRGYDPRTMTLLAFGGAGPLHALDVARALDIPRVIVPPGAGVWSAYGILSVDIQYATQRTWLRILEGGIADALHETVEAMAAELEERAVGDGLGRSTLARHCMLDLRVKGQSHHLAIPLLSAGPEGISAAVAGFHAEHRRRYGHAFPDLPLELVNIRLSVSSPRPGLEATIEGSRTAIASHQRPVWFASSPEPLLCPVHMRESLPPGAVVAGPAVVELYDTTIVLDPGDRLETRAGSQALFIDVAGAARER